MKDRCRYKRGAKLRSLRFQNRNRTIAPLFASGKFTLLRLPLFLDNNCTEPTQCEEDNTP